MGGNNGLAKPSVYQLSALALGATAILASLWRFKPTFNIVPMPVLTLARCGWYSIWLGRKSASSGSDGLHGTGLQSRVAVEAAQRSSPSEVGQPTVLSVSPSARPLGWDALEAKRNILIDAARSAHLASSSLPELRLKYPTGTDLDRWLVSLRQFSYLMREVDLMEEKLLEAAGTLQCPALAATLDTKVCRLALPLAEGVRAKALVLHYALCLRRHAGSFESVAGRLLSCWPVLAPIILSFLPNAQQSADIVLSCPGLRTDLLIAAERLISHSNTNASDEVALPGFEERLSRQIIQGSAPGGQRRSFRQRIEARRR